MLSCNPFPYSTSQIFMFDREKGEIVVGVFLDFSKAFDNGDQQLLQSYHTDRKQYVIHNGTSSATKSIRCGVPQSSTLCPLLFLI